jgi:hypothetical protein
LALAQHQLLKEPRDPGGLLDIDSVWGKGLSHEISLGGLAGLFNFKPLMLNVPN